ncbi:serine/threonine-protein kinase [Salana multivorans]
MELVPGEPLSTILARERVLARRLVLDIMAQTADALSAAHNAGVVHRDIKPANLILGPGGRVVLTDFGISLAANQAPMTAAGMVMGTAQYLPPEQAMGRAATGAGDLYALGIIAYESLVGKRPFTGATQVDIAFAHVTDPVPPLPATIDERVRTLVEGLLEKEPTRRPSPAAHVAARGSRARGAGRARRRLGHLPAQVRLAQRGRRAATRRPPSSSCDPRRRHGHLRRARRRRGPHHHHRPPAPAPAAPAPAAGDSVTRGSGGSHSPHGQGGDLRAGRRGGAGRRCE